MQRDGRGDHRNGYAAAQASGQPVGVHRGRRCQQGEIWPEGTAYVDEKRQREVGVGVPFVALIQHDRGGAW